MDTDELQTLRQRHDDLDDGLDRAAREDSGAVTALVVRTFAQTTYPTVAKSVYAVHPVTPGGNLVEGVAPTLIAGTRVFYATNLGNNIPPAGTDVVATLTKNRLVFTF